VLGRRDAPRQIRRWIAYTCSLGLNGKRKPGYIEKIARNFFS
jgi:hypothetical protein